MSADFGRRGSTGTFTDTIKAKSADQAMLLQLDSMVPLINANGAIMVLASTALPGAQGATPTATVTGLLATDTILSVSQSTHGASSLPLLGWTGQAANALTLQFSAEPGAGAIVQVAILRAPAAPLTTIKLVP